MFLNTFKYTPTMVDCHLCTEYRKPRGCTVSSGCPWLAERIEAGVVGYAEALLESFSENKRLAARLHMAVQLFSGSLWLDKQHKQRWDNAMARFAYSKKRKDTAKYYAVMYLFAASRELNRLTINCVERQCVDFTYAASFEMSDGDYTLFAAARSISVDNIGRLLQKLEDISAVGLSEFCLIVNALLIYRYGLSALDIKEKTVKREVG